jgi:hypothetical protein
VCVDAMGKVMTTYHWPLESGTIIGEPKAKVKELTHGNRWPLSTVSDTPVFLQRMNGVLEKRLRFDDSCRQFEDRSEA